MTRVVRAPKSGRAEARPPSAATDATSPRPRGRAAVEGATATTRGEGLLPTPRRLIDPRAPYLIPLLALIVARVVAWAEIGLPAEDAFITFRYARNLAAGNGLVYNPGEQVMGYTSPLWTLWLAAGYALLRDPAPWARVWSGIADVTTLLVVARLLETHVSRAAAWAFAAFFAAWPYFPASTVSCMEMNAMLALVAVSAALAPRPGPWAGPALAALALMRPEGVACAAVISLWTSWRNRIVALVLVAVGLGALAWYYGSPIPQSLLAKSRLYGIAGPWVGRHWWEWMSPVILGRWPRQGDTALLVPFLALLAPAFAVGLKRVWERRATPLAAFAAACLTVWIGYGALGVAYFWWYLLVPLAGIAAVAATGYPSIVQGRAISIAVLLVLATVWSVSRELYSGRAGQEGQAFGMAASELRRRAIPGERVLLEPIGMIGYYAPVTVIDEVGLVTPRVAARRLKGPGWYTDIVDGERPEWLVVRAGVIQSGESFAGAGAPFRGNEERERVLAQYEVVARTGAENAGNASLLILRRRS